MRTDFARKKIGHYIRPFFAVKQKSRLARSDSSTLPITATKLRVLYRAKKLAIVFARVSLSTKNRRRGASHLNTIQCNLAAPTRICSGDIPKSPAARANFC